LAARSHVPALSRASNRLDYAVFGERVRLSKPEKILLSPALDSGATQGKMSSKNVIVIGGGLAGLAAGVALAEFGWQVKLFELRPYLGAGHVVRSPSGEHVDNCQHVTLAAARISNDFYRRVGSANKVKFFDRLFFSTRKAAVAPCRPAFFPRHFT